jgi:quinol monooxygenase YgiN
MGKVVVMVNYRALPGYEDEAMHAIGRLVATVLSAEPECAGIRILRNADDPAQITLIEHWPTREVFLGPHMQQPHIRAFIQYASDVLAGPPDISFWQPTDDR